jgi:hypothetical protein
MPISMREKFKLGHYRSEKFCVRQKTLSVKIEDVWRFFD